MKKVKETVRKHDRVLEIYNRLISGEIIRKTELAEEYGVDPRSIQRDIDSIREFYSNRTTKGDEFAEIKYDHIAKGFRLSSAKTITLTNAELFTVAKMLLESRSLSKEELEKIITDLIDACLPASEKKKMRDLVLNELFHYVEPKHGKKLINTIWELGTAVYFHHRIQMEYQKVNGDISVADIKPVGIMNSEYYFYLIAYIGDKDKKHPGYPTIYRIDRIKKYKVLDDTFHVPYQNRFEEGQFRKRLQFMYGGPLTKINFIYKGTDINAVLDRLPASNYIKLEDGNFKIQTEVYGNKGIKMWLGSQTDLIQMIEE
jgi:predicted DNA-binding transcriptional regulator YafY